MKKQLIYFALFLSFLVSCQHSNEKRNLAADADKAQSPISYEENGQANQFKNVCIKINPLANRYWPGVGERGKTDIGFVKSCLLQGGPYAYSFDKFNDLNSACFKVGGDRLEITSQIEEEKERHKTVLFANCYKD